MKIIQNTEVSTVQKTDATDDHVGTSQPFEDSFAEDLRDELVALDEEAFERACVLDAKSVYHAISLLELDVLRGVRSVRQAEIDSDTLNGLAHQAYVRMGDRSRIAWRLGRAWGLANRPPYAELRLRDRRVAHDREARRAAEAQLNWELGEDWKNFELFCDEP